MSSLEVRSIREGDVERIVQIDRQVTGKDKAGFWRGMLAGYLMGTGENRGCLAPSLCPVAVSDGRVVGFMVGDVQSYQFGIPRCGRIVTVGVDPEHRRKGVARALAEALFEEFRRFDTSQVMCLVEPDDALRAFFTAVGFQETTYLTVRKDL